MTRFKLPIVLEMLRRSLVYAADVSTAAEVAVICFGPLSGAESSFTLNLSGV